MALLLQNNTVETHSLKLRDKAAAASKTARLTLGGHRSDVRTLAFSSDNLAVLSASGDTVKVWNRFAAGVRPDGSGAAGAWLFPAWKRAGGRSESKRAFCFCSGLSGPRCRWCAPWRASTPSAPSLCPATGRSSWGPR